MLCFIFEQSSALAKIIKYLKIENLVMLVYQSGPLFIMFSHNCEVMQIITITTTILLWNTGDQ